MIKLTKKNIGETIFVEGQFPVIIRHIRKVNVPFHECLEGSFFMGFNRIQYSDNGSGWYTLTASDRWEQEGKNNGMSRM